MSSSVDLILDIAAGGLIAGGVFGLILVGLQSAIADEMNRHGDGMSGWIMAVGGILIGIVFVACRLLRWP